jgi:hypothetical protein
MGAALPVALYRSGAGEATAMRRSCRGLHGPVTPFILTRRRLADYRVGEVVVVLVPPSIQGLASFLRRCLSLPPSVQLCRISLLRQAEIMWGKNPFSILT